MKNLRGIGVDGYGLKFYRKSGEVTTVLTGNVPMLRAQSLKGIAKTQDYLILGNDGICYGYYEGKGLREFPTDCKDMRGKTAEEFGINMADLL